MEKKYCPLKFTVNESGRSCNEKKCAWWVKETKDCAILMIANYIAVSWVTIDGEIERMEIERRIKEKKKAKL